MFHVLPGDLHKVGNFSFNEIELFTFKTVFKLSIKFCFYQEVLSKQKLHPSFCSNNFNTLNCLPNTEDDDEEMRCLKA